jgi:hypothetical protein
MFMLVSRPYERASLIVTSNKPFGAWDEIFGDELTAAAMVDRLVYQAEIRSLKGDSYPSETATSATSCRPKTDPLTQRAGGPECGALIASWNRVSTPRGVHLRPAKGAFPTALTCAGCQRSRPSRSARRSGRRHRQGRPPMHAERACGAVSSAGEAAEISSIPW